VKPLALTTLSLSLALAPALAPAQDAPDGRAIYQQLCAQCHGAELQGGNAQSMVDGLWNFGATKGYIARNIKHGITHLGMPAYESTLDNNQINAVVEFILAKEAEGGVERPPIPDEVQTYDYVLGVEQWLDGVETPWGIAFPDADTVLVTELPGRLRVVRDGKLDPEPVAGTPAVWAEGQSGLLDVAVDPNYGENGWVYLAYGHEIEASDASGRSPAMTRIVRGQIGGGAWENEQVVFEAPRGTYRSGGVHFGSRIIFDAEGHLYFSIGERGAPDDAQDLSLPNGKVHRVNTDGTIPADNPFLGTPGALPSIYTYGNRNPQGLAFHPGSGLIWSSEHGPMGGDELNVLRPGANYGWPVITYGRNYNGQPVSDITRKEGMEQPSLFWRPSIAVCGVNLYTGSQFPAWNNALLVAALRHETVSVLQVDGDKVMHEEVILRNVGRVRDAAPGPDGAIYVLTNTPDAVLKVTLKEVRNY